jgi:hypothetical protein
MTAVVSTDYNDKYLWYLPLTVWAWNKIGYDVICFMPYENTGNTFMHVSKTLTELPKGFNNVIYNFKAEEHKAATYCQVSRLLACCLDLPEQEQLVVSDIDMLFFSKDYIKPASWAIIDVYGADLVPPNQFPMCYLSGTVQTWRALLGEKKTYQEYLDEIVGVIECENFRGCQWSLDQDLIHRLITKSEQVDFVGHNRTNGQNQFATRRYDRDDSYILDRLSPDTIDFHMNRPGYEDANFEKIMAILIYHYPNENFEWIINYNHQYKTLLQ